MADSQDGRFTHRTYVTPGNTYETGVDVFKMLLEQGMTAHSKVCDLGCGSLRVGRFLISYLEHENYYAIEPNKWLVEAAIAEEIGSMARIKKAHIELAGRTDFNISEAFPDTVFDIVLISAILIHADHSQLADCLSKASKASQAVIFDTYPQGPDHDIDGWLYPQIAPHYDSCVASAVHGLGSKLTKFDGLDTRGAQWWRLDALRDA